jgi:opacity protein-like surface antigen
VKKIFAVVVGLFMLLLLPGVSVCSNAPETASGDGVTKQKPAKDVKASKAKKVVVSKAKNFQKGPYVSGQFGITFLPDSDDIPRVTLEFQPGHAIGMAAGYKYGKLRVEGEIGYRINDLDKSIVLGRERSASGDMTGRSFLVNGYYDFINKTAFTPYITAGIGVAKLESNDLTIAGRHIGNSDDTVFAYQVGAGVGYAINKKYTIDLKYRFSSATDPEFRGIKAHVASNNIYFGLRYNF